MWRGDAGSTTHAVFIARSKSDEGGGRVAVWWNAKLNAGIITDLNYAHIQKEVKRMRWAFEPMSRICTSGHTKTTNLENSLVQVAGGNCKHCLIYIYSYLQWRLQKQISYTENVKLIIHIRSRTLNIFWDLIVHNTILLYLDNINIHFIYFFSLFVSQHSLYSA